MLRKSVLLLVCDVLVRKNQDTELVNGVFQLAGGLRIDSVRNVHPIHPGGEVWARFVNSFNVKGHAFHASLSVGRLRKRNRERRADPTRLAIIKRTLRLSSC